MPSTKKPANAGFFVRIDSACWVHGVVSNVVGPGCSNEGLRRMQGMSETAKYTVYGALFGLCFPVGSIVGLYVVGQVSGAGLGEVLRQAHANPLLYIIDTAPFFLGLFARIAGVRQDRLLAFSASLEQQVAAKTESLRVALDAARKANETVAHMADHDALTGLLNRRRFHMELEKWTQYALRYKRCAALVFIDLDKFKGINDTCGHQAGDIYLKSVADLLIKTLRNTDIIARWGGDEFAVVLPETSREASMEVANKLIQLLNAADIDLGTHSVHASASIGVALFPDHGSKLDEIVAYADAAMYEAKAAGRNCWRLYSSSSQEMERVQAHIQWESRLRRALENDQFLLFYQPLLRLADNATAGYEALLRMEDREGRLISPGLFLESAERFGLAVPIDYMVVRKAARKVALLSGSGIWISMNLSRVSLDDSKLFNQIEAAVKENALMSGQLHIEITEAAAMEYLDRVSALVTRLRAIGCYVVLDDFGRGPGRQYLQQLPVNMVKIDGELIRDLVRGGSDKGLVREIVRSAHEKNMQVVAKNVEDHTWLDVLRELGVDYAQGFAVGMPVEAIETKQFEDSAIS